MNADDELAPAWDELLEDGLLRPPADFHARVMQRVQPATPRSSRNRSLANRVVTALQATTVVLGAIAAGGQTLAFIFGLWASSLSY